MKKLMFTAICALTLFTTSCGDDDGPDCIAETNNVVNQIEDFDFTNFSVENCNALRSALQSYLDSGCAPDEATENSFRATLETLGDCTVQ